MAETKSRRRGYFRKLGKRLEDAGDEVMGIWRTQAKRHDRVGDASYRGLEMVHSGLELATRALGRLERATVPPHRPAPHRPPAHQPATHQPATHQPAHPARPAPAPSRAAQQHKGPTAAAS